ncbi:aminotransferase class V-fold PLP-dependent enzyme [bacterium]|nr:aminotransferase class V-fold PLP-dependent enzyme [bacterium]
MKPKCVINKISYYYTHLGINIHNTDSTFCFDVYKKIEMARKTIAKIINCSPENICFVSGATEGLTMIAHGLAHYCKKAEVLLNDFEHASNLLP